VKDKTIPQTTRSANQGAQSQARTHQHYQDWATGDGVKTLYFLTKTPRDVSQLAVYVNGARKRPKDRATAYDFSLSSNNVLFVVAPPNGQYVCFDIISS
jgi:hypothetical protein